MKSQEQIAKLARILFNNLCPGIRWTELDKEYYEKAVRAMLAEMREPTEVQYNALSDKGKLWRDSSSYEVWTTYVDALLS